MISALLNLIEELLAERWDNARLVPSTWKRRELERVELFMGKDGEN